MKRALSVFLSLVLCLSIFLPGVQPLFARAESVYNGLTYYISNGKVCITGCTWDFTGDVVIPSEIDGYPVTSIGSAAFENIDGRIGKVVIPASVTELGNSAFRYIYSLYFCGSMPQMERSIFSNATVYFHEGAEGWKMGWLLIDYGDAECVQVSHITPRFTSDNNATCTKDGTERATCLTCGVEVVQTDSGSALGHSYSELVPNTDATCTANSTSTGQCDVCGVVGTVTNPGTALGHSYGSYVSDGNGSCYTDGTMSATCERCGKTDSKTEEGTGAHQYVDGICTVCGMPEGVQLSASELTYRISENQAIITGYNGTVEGLLTIPATLDGCSVTAIDPNAFAGCTDLKAVFLPKGVRSIGEAAFRDCSGLKILSFTSDPVQIAADAFTGVTATVCYPGGDGGWTDENCQNYGGTLSWRSHDAAYTSDKNATCTDDGTKTGACCLCGMSSTVTDAGSAKGHNAGNLITVKENNVDEEGLKERRCTRCKEVLYSEVLPRCGTGYYGPLTYTLSTDGKISIIECDPWAEGVVVVPDTINGYPVTQISGSNAAGIDNPTFGDWEGAFENCEYLTEVVLPEGITGITESAFYSCGRLTRLTIPSSVSYIGAYAFAYCPKLDTVEFTGSAPTFGTYYDIWDWEEPEKGCLTFEGSNVTAYYPENAGWTQSIRSDCGTGVTWVVGCSTHSAGEWTTETQATATAYGLEALRCTVCDALLEARHPVHPDSVVSGTYKEGQSWQLDRISGILTISGEGTLTDQMPWYSYRSQILRINILDGITKIGDGAFENLSKLQSISIPDTVISLGVENFTGCSALEYTTEVYGSGNSEDITAYYLGSASNPYHILTALTMEKFEGDYYPSWAKYSFYVDINRLCKVIGPYVDQIPLYYERIDYFKLIVPDGLRGISDYGFEYSVAHFDKIPSSLTYIGRYSLGFKVLGSEITLPPAVAEIGNNAFSTYSSLKSVSFTGSAPKIGAYAFSGRKATVYYPANDPTWTEEVRQNYGGTLTWRPVCDQHTPGEWVIVQAPTVEAEGVQEQRCSVCGEVLNTASVDKLCKPELTLKYPTVSFKEEVVMNVYFDAQKLDDVVQMGLITYDSEVDQWGIDNAGHVISGYSYAEAEGLYVARTQGIPAAQMDQPMYFALYAQLTDGSYTYSSLVSYSPTTYAYNQLEDETMGTIVVALLNYGAAAQTYFGTDTDGLMNSNLTAEQQAMAESYRSDMITPVTQVSADQQGEYTNTGGFDRRYPNISFEGIFSIGYFVAPSATPVDGVTMYVWDQTTVDSGALLTAENAVDTLAMTDLGNGTWQAAVENIAACQLDEGVYVAFCYSDGQTDYCSGVLAYSIGTYCASKANSTDPIAPLARTTAVYGYYAKQLFGE